MAYLSRVLEAAFTALDGLNKQAFLTELVRGPGQLSSNYTSFLNIIILIIISSIITIIILLCSHYYNIYWEREEPCPRRGRGEEGGGGWGWGGSK